MGVNTAIGTIAGAVAMTDERGFLRIVNNTVDIGAVEFQPPATTTQLNVTPNPVELGNPVTFTATVTAQQNGSNPVTGTVTFTVNGTAQTPVALTNGTATLTLSTLTAGANTITATYNGDPNFTPSMATPVVETVAAPAVTVTMSSNNTMVTTGQPVTMTITVTPQGGGTPPSGPVQVTIDQNANKNFVATMTVAMTNGTATFTMPAGSLPTGDNNFTATFQGNTSAPCDVTVQGVMDITSQMTITQVSIVRVKGKGKGKARLAVRVEHGAHADEAKEMAREMAKKATGMQMTMMVTNNTAQAFQGPVYFVVDCLSTGWTLQNKTGTTKGNNPASGDPFVQFIPAGGQLNAGASAMVTLDFVKGKKATTKTPTFNNFVFEGPGTL